MNKLLVKGVNQLKMQAVVYDFVFFSHHNHRLDASEYRKLFITSLRDNASNCFFLSRFDHHQSPHIVLRHLQNVFLR